MARTSVPPQSQNMTTKAEPNTANQLCALRFFFPRPDSVCACVCSPVSRILASAQINVSFPDESKALYSTATMAIVPSSVPSLNPKEVFSAHLKHCIMNQSAATGIFITNEKLLLYCIIDTDLIDRTQRIRDEEHAV